jgi:hypothetical protein
MCLARHHQPMLRFIAARRKLADATVMLLTRGVGG